MKTLPALMALSALLAACSAPAPRETPRDRPFVLQSGESAQSMNLRVNQPLILRLPSNPSTGYSWTLPVAPQLLRVEGKPGFEEANTAPGVVGAGGQEVWTLRALTAGEETLRFEYRRPWEKDAPPARSLLYRIEIY